MKTLFSLLAASFVATAAFQHAVAEEQQQMVLKPSYEVTCKVTAVEGNGSVRTRCEEIKRQPDGSGYYIEYVVDNPGSGLLELVGKPPLLCTVEGANTMTPHVKC